MAKAKNVTPSKRAMATRALGVIDAAEESGGDVQATQLQQVETLALAMRQIGATQGIRMLQKLGEASQLQLIAQMKETKTHEMFGLTWEDFCQKHFQCTARSIDGKLLNLRVLGDQFSETAFRLGLPTRSLDALRGLPDDARLQITGGKVVDLEKATKQQIKTAIEMLVSEHEARQAETRKALEAEEKDHKRTKRALAEEEKGRKAEVDQLAGELKHVKVQAARELGLAEQLERAGASIGDALRFLAMARRRAVQDKVGREVLEPAYHLLDSLLDQVSATLSDVEKALEASEPEGSDEDGDA